MASFLAFAIGYRAIGARWRDGRVNTPSDWRGLTLFTVGTAILVIGLVRTTSTLGGWAQSGVLACFACSGLLLAAFVAVEAVSPHPLLDVSLFRSRTVAGSAVAAFGLSAAVFGPFIFVVLFLSYDRGYSTQSIGVHLFLLSGVTLVLLPLAGLLDRYLPVKFVICSGLVLVGVGLWLVSRAPGSAGWADLIPGLVTVGVGLELVNPRLGSTAAAAAGPAERSLLAASRTISTMRQLGAAIGVAVLGSVFATRLSDELSSQSSAFSQLSGQGPQMAGLVLEGRRAAAAQCGARQCPPSASIGRPNELRRRDARSLIGGLGRRTAFRAIGSVHQVESTCRGKKRPGKRSRPSPFWPAPIEQNWSPEGPVLNSSLDQERARKARQQRLC